ncbi:MAG: hypothetical protein ACYDCL_04545 [Myxococcales bacterium]
MRAPLIGWIVLCLGCGAASPAPRSSPDAGQQPAGPTYADLQAQLEAGRSQFLPTSEGATELASAPSSLYWLEFPGYDPTLHRWDAQGSQRIDYTFSIGTGDGYNFQGSDRVVVSASNDGNGNVIFSAWDATAPNTPLGQATVPAPTDGEKWWTYSVDGDQVYFAESGSGAASVWRWTPAGGGSPAQVAQLDASIAALGALGVVGSSCGVIDSGGGVWLYDLGSGSGAFLQNAQQATGFSLGAGGLLYTTDGDAFFYSSATKQTTDVGAALQASSYELLPDMPDAHWYSSDATLWSGSVVYTAQQGIFRFDLGSGTVTPVLLNGPDAQVIYRYPTPLADGSLFVVGLESSDGATGADGPIFEVKLSPPS